MYQHLGLWQWCCVAYKHMISPRSLYVHMYGNGAVLVAGNLVFHGPQEEVVPFFESMRFYVPERKAVSDFLQEVTSKKDQKVRMNVYSFVRMLQCL